jgi:hypothetical protein
MPGVGVCQMPKGTFNQAELRVVCDALDIAEDKTGEHYKFSLNQWKRHRYDVKTLPELEGAEISSEAFAVLNKYSTGLDDYKPKAKRHDYYAICLQDHRILDALDRDKNLNLLPILIYIFTHELIHIVRFCNYVQRFEIFGPDREKEEQVVHETTFDVLKNLRISNMEYVLESYSNHRMCELNAFCNLS